MDALAVGRAFQTGDLLGILEALELDDRDVIDMSPPNETDPDVLHMGRIGRVVMNLMDGRKLSIHAHDDVPDAKACYSEKVEFGRAGERVAAAIRENRMPAHSDLALMERMAQETMGGRSGHGQQSSVPMGFQATVVEVRRGETPQSALERTLREQGQGPSDPGMPGMYL